MTTRCPKCGTELPQGTPAWVRDLKVADVMTRNPVTLGPEESLARALEVMRAQGVRRIPVEIAGRLVGLLAEGDLKRAEPSPLISTQEEFQRVMDETPISRIMISNPITVTEDVPLAEAAQTLCTTKFGVLPVLRDGDLVGILTDTDVARALVELLTQAG